MKMTVETEYTEPNPVMMTIGEVRFMLGGFAATLYRMAEFCGETETFLKEMKPLYMPQYMAATKLKEAAEQTKQECHERWEENYRLSQNEKRNERRRKQKAASILADHAAPL